jgi:hypothetical protein
MAGLGNPSFDVFRLPPEHDELRAVLRDIGETEIAPYAAEVDGQARFPEEALKILNETDFRRYTCPRSTAVRVRIPSPRASSLRRSRGSAHPPL